MKTVHEDIFKASEDDPAVAENLGDIECPPSPRKLDF
jgi:hypothetical protein